MPNSGEAQTGGDTDAAGAAEYLELTDDAIMTVGDGVIRWVSPSWTRLTGLSRSELIGHSPSEFVHPEDLQDLPFDQESRGLRHRARIRAGHDGWHWYEHQFTPRWAADGSVESFLIHSRDIAEQVQLEDQLADSERRLRVALDALPDGFAIHRANRTGIRQVPAPRGTGTSDGTPPPVHLTLVYINPAGAASLASTPERLVGLEVRHQLPAGEIDPVPEALLDVAQHGRPRRLRHVVRPADGPTRVYESYIAPLDQELVMSTWRDITDAEQARQTLENERLQAEHRSRHDALTGLPNRILLHERLGEALEQARRGELVGVLFCDLVGFKQINDQHGHAAGDVVLQATATRLVQSLRSHDTAARLAGDEFVVVLRHLSHDWRPDLFLDRLSETLSEPVNTHDTAVRPAASLGLVLADPVDGPPEHRDPQKVLALADHTMYVSKASGRPVLRPPAATL